MLLVYCYIMSEILLGFVHVTVFGVCACDCSWGLCMRDILGFIACDIFLGYVHVKCLMRETKLNHVGLVQA